MKTKPTWTATNEAGAKLYYYEGLGWIDSSTGLVTGFDTRDVQFQPEDATHVWINRGRVKFLKEHRAFPGQFELWDVACWGGTVKQLKGVVVPLGGGTVVAVSDDYVATEKKFNAWDGRSARPVLATHKVEVQLRNGKNYTGHASDFNWRHEGMNQDVMWWRDAC